MSKSEKAGGVQEFNMETLENMFRNSPHTIADIPTDPEKYTLLFHSEVIFEGKMYELLYKACRIRVDHLVTKLSLVEKDSYKSQEQKERYLQRRPDPSIHPQSADDSVLNPGEVAFRYLLVNLYTNPTEVKSRLEVDDNLRGKGLGSLLFNAYELLAIDATGRMPHSSTKPIKLFVREHSVPKGWTTAKALKSGYTPLSSFESPSSLPTFQKIIPPLAKV